MRRAEKEVAALEADIPLLERAQAALYEQLAAAATPESDRVEAGRKLKEIEDSLRLKIAAWETAGNRRDELAGQI